MSGPAARGQVAAFFGLAYGISWSLWVPLALSDVSPSSSLLALVFLGSFGPTLSAALLTAVSEGGAGLRRLLGRLLRWRVGARWYAAVLLGPVVLALAATALHALLGGALPRFGGAQIPEGLSPPVVAVLLLPAFLVSLVIGGPLGEELGWRGYALPRMQTKLTPLAASLVLGLAWALWHLPLFYVAGTGQSFLPFLPFVVWVVALSVVFSWAYNGSGGSVLVAVLLHGAVNFSAAVFGLLPASGSDPALPFLLYAFLVLLASLFLGAFLGPRLTLGPRGSGRAF